MTNPTDVIEIDAEAPDPSRSEAQFAPGGFRTESSIGEDFQRSSDKRAAPAASNPTPLPKRPKGRLFVGALLLIVCFLLGRAVWSA